MTRFASMAEDGSLLFYSDARAPRLFFLQRAEGSITVVLEIAGRVKSHVQGVHWVARRELIANFSDRLQNFLLRQSFVFRHASHGFAQGKSICGASTRSSLRCGRCGC